MGRVNNSYIYHAFAELGEALSALFSCEGDLLRTRYWVQRFLLPAPEGDDHFCPLDGDTFTCSGVKYISQEHVDMGEVVHESTVSANPLYSEEVVEVSSSLHTPLLGECAISIGEHLLLQFDNLAH